MATKEIHTTLRSRIDFNSIFKAELQQRLWRSIDDVEITAPRVPRPVNHRRLHRELGLIPSAEYETNQHHPTFAGTSSPVGDTEGPRKDHAVVLPGADPDHPFDADNPGRWMMIHCHDAYYAQPG